MKQYVIYSRQSKVSDLDNQMTLETADFTIKYYLKTVGVEGVDYEIVASFEEVKSGYGKKARSREEFNKATKLCYEKGYSLIVSNISRLARNTAYGAQLIEDLDIVIASNPTANKTMKNLMLVMAEDESYQQSLRRKATCEAKRDKCKRLGIKFVWGGSSPKWRAAFTENRAKGLHKYQTTKVSRTNDKQLPLVNRLKSMISDSNGQLTQKQMCEKLTLEGFTNSKGGEISQGSLAKLIKKYGLNND